MSARAITTLELDEAERLCKMHIDPGALAGPAHWFMVARLLREERASRATPPASVSEIVPDDACKPEALCWRAEELIAEVFGVEDGVVPNKTTADAFVEIRRLRDLAQRAETPSLVDVIRSVPRPEGMHPEVHAIGAMTAHFRKLGDEPCSECGYSLNEIGAYVQIVVAAKELCRSGYDGPFSGDAVAPLFRAVAEYEASTETGSTSNG